MEDGDEEESMERVIVLRFLFFFTHF